MHFLNLLTQFGLSEVGTWSRGSNKSVEHLRDVVPFGLQFDVGSDWRKVRGAVYAIVTGEEVLYVGETSRPLAERLADYRYGNPLPPDTDNRIKIEITRRLAEKHPVSIWAGRPSGAFTTADGETIEISAAKPVEEVLIQRIGPPLNVKNLMRDREYPSRGMSQILQSRP